MDESNHMSAPEGAVAQAAPDAAAQAAAPAPAGQAAPPKAPMTSLVLSQVTKSIFELLKKGEVETAMAEQRRN